ncbi:Asp-tRNA(Asn)/Glu-tRNA(Gln) amidotransferase subunit GatC [Candidatus Pelagibacter sp.]|nr:Asp-tRNA(Asn)/Glu-tRNA(Gln) amidotransferase subunit GatC [Candidatus Pelagibacter sp.]
MTIDLKTIKHISKLSRILVDDAKADKLAVDLNSIFDFIEKLNELNTDNVEPLTSVAEITLKLRNDKVESKNIRDQVLKNSPDKNEDFFVVPRVVE